MRGTLLILAMLGLFFCKHVKGQELKSSRIYLKEIDQFIIFDSPFPDTDTVKMEKGKAIVTILNDKGKGTIKKYSPDGSLEFEGQYIESLDLLKGYQIFRDLIEDKKLIVVVDFYQPLPHGIWKYYDRKGKIIEEVTYEKGIAY